MDAASLSRRHVTLMAFGALILGKSALGSRASAGNIVLPSGDCILSRSLTRGLRDGNAVSVARSWRIRFARQSRGIAIYGEQVSVAVEAPENLDPIAKIEKERSTKGLFPILLAPDGIVVAAGQNTAQSSFDAAVRTAEAMLAKQEDGTTHARYLAELQLAGSSLLDEMPGDLFYPSTKPFRDVRQILLPDGGSGEFEVRWIARARDDTGLLDMARREVITRIGTNERRSNEEWSLKTL